MKKVRYAVVGAGWISQEAFMPSVSQTGNSVLTAIVTGNMANALKLAGYYGIKHVFGYEQYEEMLGSGLVDAVYIALPNSMHADFAIRAASAGVHVLVEKPLATSVAECEAMIAAADRSGAKLMTAYRLHYEPGTVEALETIRRGDIGDPRVFISVFSFQSAESNHRLKGEHWGGPLQDIGVYCLNVARHVFNSEPCEAVAIGGRDTNDPRFAEVDEAICATLKFPGGRIATFVASFGGAPLDMYRVIGSKGELEMSPGFRFETATRLRLNKDGHVAERSFPQVDHFSGQVAYFSDCILQDKPPEADGREGLADVRALLAIEAAARTGQSQRIDSPPRLTQLSSSAVQAFPPVERRLVL